MIAAEIGDKTGASIVSDTYGDLPPNWMDTKAGKLTWLPDKGKPAWEAFVDSWQTTVVPVQFRKAA